MRLESIGIALAELYAGLHFHLLLGLKQSQITFL